MAVTETPRTLPLAVPPLEAARLIGISRTGLYRLSASGEIRLIKVGARTLVRTADLTAFLDRLATAAH